MNAPREEAFMEMCEYSWIIIGMKDKNHVY